MKAGLTVETVTRSRKVVSTSEHLVMARQLEMEWPDTPPIYTIDNVVTVTAAEVRGGMIVGYCSWVPGEILATNIN